MSVAAQHLRARRLAELGYRPLRLRRCGAPGVVPEPMRSQPQTDARPEATSDARGQVLLLTAGALPERLQRHLQLAFAHVAVRLRHEAAGVAADELSKAIAVVALGGETGRTAAAALAATTVPVVIAAAPAELATATARRALWDQLRPLLRNLAQRQGGSG